MAMPNLPWLPTCCPRLIGAEVVWLGLAGQFRRDHLTVARDFGDAASLAPAQLGCHQRGGARCGLPAAITGLDGGPGPAGQHVVKPDRTFVGAGVHDLGAEIAARTRDGLPEGRPGRDQSEEVADIRSVTPEQALNLADCQPAVRGDLL